eukprot:scaffold378367_cov19-Prasinocladus_malaysianus.AAC.1
MQIICNLSGSKLQLRSPCKKHKAHGSQHHGYVAQGARQHTEWRASEWRPDVPLACSSQDCTTEMGPVGGLYLGE